MKDLYNKNRVDYIMQSSIDIAEAYGCNLFESYIAFKLLEKCCMEKIAANAKNVAEVREKFDKVILEIG